VKAEDKIREGAKPFLEEGEEILAGFVARPRGYTQQNAGVRGLGSNQAAKAAASKVVKVTVRGHEFKLEAGAGANAKGVVEAFEQRRGAAV
jgi:hypothetical protein